MEAEHIALQPVMVRRVGSLIMPRNVGNASKKSLVWKRVATVAVLGAIFGFAVSFWLGASKPQYMAPVGESRSRSTSVLVIPAASAPVKQETENSAEVERLKTRNRRLEALVQVLQQRAQTGGQRNVSSKNKN